MPRVAPAVIVSVPALALGVVLAVVLALVGTGLVVAVIIGVLVAVAVGFWLWRRAPRATLDALGAGPLHGNNTERLRNVVEGLCATLGVTEPALHVVEVDAANAAVVGTSGSGSHLVVTRGLLDSFDRLELEAVVARELCRIRQGLDSATVLAGVVGLLGSGALAERIMARLLDPRPVSQTDMEAVRLTRYPPALASAFEKAAGKPVPEAPPATRHLWLIEPASVSGIGLAQPPLVHRIDVLREI